MNLLPHIRASILQQRGGAANWQTLEPVVTAMTDAQLAAFYRTLQNAKDDGKADGTRDARRHPWKFFGRG